MSATRQARKRPGHLATDGVSRNAGRREVEEVDNEQLIERFFQRVILEGVSHPIFFDAQTRTLPQDSTVFQMAIPRDGQINEMAVFCEQIIDGPAYIRLFDQDGPVIDKEGNNPIEVLLSSAEWATFPVFEVTTGQRLRFVVDNVRTFPQNMSNEDITLATGSESLSLLGVWATAMYFAKGGNSGAGQQPERPDPPRP